VRKTVGVLAIAAAMMALVGSAAGAWTCKATSRTGSWGWGTSGYRNAAARRALYECAVRTPRGYTCYLRYCR
jgi:hypothetical protein